MVRPVVLRPARDDERGRDDVEHADGEREFREAGLLQLRRLRFDDVDRVGEQLVLLQLRRLRFDGVDRVGERVLIARSHDEVMRIVPV